MNYVIISIKTLIAEQAACCATHRRQCMSKNWWCSTKYAY